MAALDIFQTSVEAGTMTKSNPTGDSRGGGDGGNGGDGDGEGESPSFVTRESFLSFTGASAAIAALTLGAARAGLEGDWVPFVLALIWGLLMIWSAFDKNPDAPGSEKAIAVFIGVANACMLGTVGYGADQAVSL